MTSNVSFSDGPLSMDRIACPRGDRRYLAAQAAGRDRSPAALCESQAKRAGGPAKSIPCQIRRPAQSEMGPSLSGRPQLQNLRSQAQNPATSFKRLLPPTAGSNPLSNQRHSQSRTPRHFTGPPHHPVSPPVLPTRSFRYKQAYNLTFEEYGLFHYY